MSELEPIIDSHQRIDPFYDPVTCSWSYVLVDLASKACAVIDPVLNFDPASGRVSYELADSILARIDVEGWSCHWVLETHIHADHVSSGDYLRSKTGAQIGIGAGVRAVSAIFEPVFDLGPDHPDVEVCFDRLFKPNETIGLGELQINVLATPGHTPGCVAYSVENAIFVGDTLFMPDYGTARSDFPGGDAGQLFDSVMGLLSVDPMTQLYFCHDYPLPERPTPQCSSSAGAQRANVQLQDRDREQFVEFRHQRDSQLATPRLLYPSIQINLAAGRLPAADQLARRYLKLPIVVAR